MKGRKNFKDNRVDLINFIQFIIDEYYRPTIKQQCGRLFATNLKSKKPLDATFLRNNTLIYPKTHLSKLLLRVARKGRYQET